LHKIAIKKNKSEIYNLNSEPNNKYDAEYLATKFVDLWDSSIKIKIQSNEEFKEVDILKINSSKAKLNLGWEPKLTIDQMIDQTVSWEKTHISNQSVDFSLMQINEYLN
jgi:CDP-glucose 4,6-dehydratase